MQTKQLVVAFLVTIIVVMLSGMAIAKSFDDVPRSHWAYDAVEYLASKGLIEGFGDGTYRGDKDMTRYELAMLIARAYARMEEMSDKDVSIDVEAIMNDLMDEFEGELADIRDLVKSGMVRLEDVERKTEENSQANSDLAAKLDQLGSKFKFNGSMRLRLESKWYDPGDKRRVRPRIQFLFNMKAPVNDEVTFGAQLSTGGVGTATSRNQTLTNGFGIHEFDVSRAYLMYEPEEWPNWTFWGGKFKPIWVEAANFMDTDINVEGVAQRYQSDNWVVNLSQMVPANKGGYIVAQVGATDLFSENLDAYLTYHYLSSGAFETLGPGFPFWFRLDADDYSAIEGLAKYQFDWMDWPIFLQAAYRMNLADEWATYSSGLQQAAMAEIKIGKIKEVHDYSFGINYGRILPNALIPQFADGDRGVDVETWKLTFAYQLMSDTQFKIAFYHGDMLTANPNQSWDMIQADVVTKF